MQHKNTVEEGNRLIAEFMGHVKRYMIGNTRAFVKEEDLTDEIRKSSSLEEYWGEAKEFDRGYIWDSWDGYMVNNVTNTRFLEYHKTWNLLMPVYQKWRKILEENDVKYTTAQNPMWLKYKYGLPHSLILGDIERFWRWMVDFIQWYNSNNTTK